MLSNDPDAKYLLSLEKLTDITYLKYILVELYIFKIYLLYTTININIITKLVCPVKVCFREKSCVFHIFIVLSLDPDAKYLLSFEKLTDKT